MWNGREALHGTTQTRSPQDQTAGCASACSPDVFEEIYQSHWAFVRRMCRRMLRDPIEAEDAAQDVFIRVFLKLHTFRGDAAFSSWLYRLVTNVVLMRFRKNRRPISLDELPDIVISGRAESARQSRLRSSAVDKIDLQTAINHLTPGLRRVLVLHDIQGYRHREIAELLGYSDGNSKSQLHRARARLRKLLRSDKTV
jgi:RNA polymerase sigma-70 factor (ECF subfamily)